MLVHVGSVEWKSFIAAAGLLRAIHGMLANCVIA